MERLLVRLADAAGRWRRWIVGAWLIAFLAMAPLAGGVADRLSSGGFEVPGSQSVRVIDELDRAGRGAQSFTLVVDAPDAARASTRLEEVREQLAADHPEILFPQQPEASADGSSVTVTGYATLSQDQALDLAGTLIDEVQVTQGDVRTFLAGPGATYSTFQDVTTADIAAAERIGLPLVLIVLVALFGALVASLLPFALGLASVVITLGLVAVIADRTEVSVYAQSMVSMIGLGVAVDYSLFILARYREEMRRGVEHAAAVRDAMRTSGTAVVFSGLTVIVSLGTVWLIPVRAVQSMAGAAMLVTAVAIVAAATLLPALLHIVGRSVDRGRVPFVGARDTPGAGSFWGRFAGRIMRRPWPWLLGAASLLIVLALPVLDLRTLNIGTGQLPSDEPVVEAERILSAEITGPGQGRAGQFALTVHPREGATQPQVQAVVSDLRQGLEGIDGIKSSAIEPLASGTTLIVAPLEVDPESRQVVDRIVPAVRELAAASDPAVATVNVGGISAFQEDLNEEIVGRLPLVIAALLVSSYLLLLVLLRSVLLPLKAVIMNLLSIGAAYGVLIAVFQWGWFDWLGYDSLGVISPLTLPLVLTITFGLSMDYEVFLLSRIKERYEEHGDNTRAVAEGLTESARLITSAALIMVVVFGAFVLTGVPAIKETGLGLAVAIAIDATITRLILVPSTMRVLGDWNWWLPAWLDRLLPHLAHAERS